MPFGILINDLAGRTPDNILPGDIQTIDRALLDSLIKLVRRVLENS